MRYWLLALCLLFFSPAFAQQTNYAADQIPKELLPYASAVIRNQQVHITVKGLDDVLYDFKQVITVLNRNGDEFADVSVWYDKFVAVKNIKGVIYDAAGKQISKFSESNFEDSNTEDGFSLYEDEKIKHYSPSVTEYPYTVECEYQLRFKQTGYFPDWEPNADFGIAIEKGSYDFTCKPDFEIRYKENHMPAGVNITTNKDGLKNYNWQISNLKAVKSEPYSPNAGKYLSSVMVAPKKFEYAGINGVYSNWQEYGKWMYDKLLANRQDVSPETAQHITDLTAGIKDPKLKAKMIYEYVQSKTRYVNISIGIGGLQPMLAADVDKVNYGDCKALVNYTHSLLKIAGIDSYYCEVMANSGDHIKQSLLPDFASMGQSNHIILCIPFKNDTTWCDCTSQTIPFGYLGDFTDDRTVLACTPDGGKVLHTPKYTTADNLETRKGVFALNEDGQLSGDMTSVFKGIRYEIREDVIEETGKERDKRMQYAYPINNMHIQKLEFNQDKSLQPSTTENLKLTAPEFASADGGKMSFLPNLANRLHSVPKQVHNRITDVCINEGHTDEDEITYTLPTGYHMVSEPYHFIENKPFGSYKASITTDGDKLIYKRTFRLKDGTYAKDNYGDLVDFLQDVSDADKFTVSIAKN